MYRRTKERKGQSPSREKRTQKSGSFSKKATKFRKAKSFSWKKRVSFKKREKLFKRINQTK